ncbi:MAG: branched-chain amino acid ABC transporter permease [Candidatus Hodarchaeota archaeon]
MATIKTRSSIVFVAILFALAALPLVVSDFYLIHVIITMILNMLIGLSLFIIVRTGQLSIGHAAFMAVGGYSSALLVMKLGISTWLAMPIAGLVAAFFAALVGYPCLRIRGLYFVLITFAINEVIRLLILNLDDLTGGADGLQNIPYFGEINLLPIMKLNFSSFRLNYYLILFLCLITFLFVMRLWKSRVGRICEAIEADEMLSGSIGINVMKHKMVVFTIGCFWAGIGGSFLAHYNRILTPSDFTIWNSIIMLMFIQVGGLGSIFGVIVGATVITLLFEVFRFALSLRPLLFGALLIAVMLWLPGGLITLVPRIADLAGFWKPCKVKRTVWEE